MNIQETSLPGVFVLEPKVFHDPRGFFVETFRDNWLRDVGVNVKFVQGNHSRSRRGILRGLHYQMQQTQGKLVRVSRGKVFDVAVDVRRGSASFGQWVGVELDDQSHRMLYVPPGFAHGFIVVSEEADFLYQCTDYYHPQSEQGICWNDPDIGIQWPDVQMEPLVSAKDAQYPRLTEQLADRLPAYSQS